MAIYHLSTKIVSRGRGHNVVAKAAYRCGEKLRDERSGETKDYRRRHGVEFSGMYAPANAPDWTRDREAFWNAVERREDESTRPEAAQLAREIEIALPHELSAEQRRYLVQDFIRENFTRRGYVVDCAIHEPSQEGDERNHHAHLLISMRTVDEEGFSDTKDRSQNQKEALERWREQWARTANRHLERWGHATRIDHRSLEAQGIDREPTNKIGEAALQMERRGEASERGEQHRAILARNANHQSLKREMAALDAAIERERTAVENERLAEEVARQQAAEREAARLAQERQAQERQQQIRAAEQARQQAAEREAARLAQERQAQERQQQIRAAEQARQQAAEREAARLAQERQTRERQQQIRAAEQAKERERERERLRGPPSYSARARVEAVTSKTLQVTRGVAGGVTTSLAKCVDGLLDFFVGGVAKAKLPLTHNERRDQLLQRMEADRKRDEALEHIAEDIRSGRGLAFDDVRQLTPADLQNIHRIGDDYLHQLIRQHEEERQRDGGRYRER